jgi:MFS family permease
MPVPRSSGSAKPVEVTAKATLPRGGVTGRRALRFVLVIGVVSFFADMTYEGARSITGPYLLTLGASATVVGFVAGFGELVGYGLRVASGRAADRTGRYWPIAMGGYVLQMTAVPLLALAGNWQIAAVLIVAERTGKAVRNPPRDVMLSHASEEMGQGWGFGVHEALDQSGALVGPLVAAAVLYLKGDYVPAFAILAIPATITLVLFASAWRAYPDVGARLPGHVDALAGSFQRPFWLYLAAVALVGAGFADFTLMAYHFQHDQVIDQAWTPVFYAVAMAVSGLGSLVFGRMFDRVGLGVLIPLTVVSAAFAPLVFYGSFGPALLGTALWGLGTGVHESVMAAAVAVVVPLERRAGRIRGVQRRLWRGVVPRQLAPGVPLRSLAPWGGRVRRGDPTRRCARLRQDRPELPRSSPLTAATVCTNRSSGPPP